MTTSVEHGALSAASREFFIQLSAEEIVPGLYELCTRSRFNFDVIAIYTKVTGGSADYDADFAIGGVQIADITADGTGTVNSDGSISIDNSSTETYTVAQDSAETQRMVKDTNSPLTVTITENVAGTRLQITVWCRKLQDQSASPIDDPS